LFEKTLSSLTNGARGRSKVYPREKDKDKWYFAPSPWSPSGSKEKFPGPIKRATLSKKVRAHLGA